MASVTPEEIVALAELARLRLAPDTVQALTPQLARILTYIERLHAVPIDGVPEYDVHDQPDSSLREDAPGPTLPAELALAGVPRRRGRLVVVPKFKEE